MSLYTFVLCKCVFWAPALGVYNGGHRIDNVHIATQFYVKQLYRRTTGSSVSMELQYRIVVELSNQDQVAWAYQLFAEDSAVQHQKQEESHRERDKHFCKDTSDDWRFGELSIGKLNNMDVTVDPREKDLLISQYLGHGIIRLFRLTDAPDETELESDLQIIPGDDTMVCILFVPTYFTVHELLHFYIGDEIVNNQISNFRILRNKKSNLGFNFMVLMKFKDPLRAKMFKDEFNGKRFSKVDPETCHVISIKEVVFKRKLFQRQETDELPYLLTDPFITISTYKETLKKVELPTCPVCLERMDSDTTGLITIPCQHTFHCQCLDKWKNSKCPVCRYSSLKLSRDSAVRQNSETTGCSTCGCHENLWICLICGNIGCGRYNSKHAIQHYDSTSHCFAMDMRTQRVWDYAGDNYVHRLVQNEVDGKLVEVEAEGTSSSSRRNPITSSSGESNDKDDNMAANFMRNKEYHLEYVQVLISQLESQREYYETKLDQMQNLEIQTKDADLRPLRQEIKSLKLSFEKCQLKWEQGRIQQQKQLDEDRLVIRGLQENLDHSNEERERQHVETNRLRNEKQELEEQVQDLMFYLESQEKFKDADESVREGTVVVQRPPVLVSSSGSKPKKKTKSKRKNKPS